MEMKEMTLAAFAAKTASNEPAPGGGSISAMAAAFSAALAEMVAQLTVGKKGYEGAEAEMKALIETASALRLRLLDDIQRDSTSFDAFMQAMALPRDTDEQKALRREQMQSALKAAAEVPFEVAQTASEILPLSEAVVRSGNSNAVTDGLVSAMLARTAVLGALLNVKINLGSIKDEAYVAEMTAKVRRLEQHVIAREREILALAPALA